MRSMNGIRKPERSSLKCPSRYNFSRVSCSRSVGIRVFNGGTLWAGVNRAYGHLRLFKSMEHLNYACHAEEFLFPNGCFAV